MEGTRMLTPLEQAIDSAATAVTRVLGCAVLAAVALNLANVVGRYGFGRALLGAEELQVFISIWVTFLGAAVLAWRDQHLRMDVLLDQAGSTGRKTQRFIEHTLTAVLAAFVAVTSWTYTIDIADLGQVSDGSDVPMWIPHAAVPVGFTLIAVIAAGRLVQRAIAVISGRSAEPTAAGGAE
jgi:TRAP-type C4-dicarboxylate transport system permease small subunit